MGITSMRMYSSGGGRDAGVGCSAHGGRASLSEQSSTVSLSTERLSPLLKGKEEQLFSRLAEAAPGTFSQRERELCGTSPVVCKVRSPHTGPEPGYPRSNK